MRKRLRSVARLSAFAALALLLSGCIRLTMDLQVNSNDTVSGTVQLGVQKELLELSGGSIDDIIGTDSPFPSDAPGVTVEDFDDGEFAGQQFNFDSVPISEFQDETDAESLNIQRQGDTYVVTGVLDMRGGATGATGAIGATGQQILESAEIRVTITFPGDVAQANGAVDNNTVTWEPKFGERLELTATASAIDDGDAGGGGGSSLTTILIIAAIVIVALVVVFLVMKSRRGGGGGAVAPATPMGGQAPPAAPPAPPAAPPAPPVPPVAPPGSPPE